MIIKAMDDKSDQIAILERLQKEASREVKGKIEQELRNLQAGIKGEQESAYLLDFHYGKSERTAVLHDLRFEVDNRVAQIDHLLIHRSLTVFVLESKHFHAGVKITEEGEFLRWNAYRRSYEGMPSPLAQNERHVAVLCDVFSKLNMPKRLGIPLTPVFHSYVLVDPKARIDRPKTFDTSRVIKADSFDAEWDKLNEKAGVLDTVGMLSRYVSRETLEGISQQLMALHKPASIDYVKRFGIAEPAQWVKTPDAQSEFACRQCGSTKLSIQHGRYGYYFKCSNCEGNTPIKVGCGYPGHKERIRKDGRNFYRECADCRTSSVYFVNAE